MTAVEGVGAFVRPACRGLNTSLPGARLRVHKKNADGSIGERKYDPIGGDRYVVLEIVLDAGDWLDSQTRVDVRVHEDQDGLHAAEDAKQDITYFLDTASGWQELVNGAWIAATEGPGEADNSQGTEPRRFRCAQDWHTTTSPLGHNGAHSVRVYKVNNQESDTLRFKHAGAQDPFYRKVAGKSANVKNLVVTNVETSCNLDYIKYDPDSEDENLNNPWFTFNVEDEGDPHQYDCYVVFHPTGAGSFTRSLVPGGDWYCIRAVRTNPGSFGVSLWTDDICDSYGYEVYPWEIEKDTYTFEIYAYEAEDAVNLASPVLDQHAMKVSHWLSLSDHTFEFRLDEEDNVVAYGSYTLADPDDKEPHWVSIHVLDPNLETKETVAGPGTEIDEPYEDIELYTLDPDDEGGEWRAIFTAEDDHAAQTRDHQPNRMMAFNAPAARPQAHLYDYLPVGADAAGAYYLGKHLWDTGPTKVVPYQTKALGAAPFGTVFTYMPKDSVWYWCGHSSAGNITVAGATVSAEPGTNPPAGSLSNYRMSKCLLAVFHGCETAQTESHPGLMWGNLLDTARTVGAQCALGFEDAVDVTVTGDHAHVPLSKWWSDWFFEALCWGEYRDHTARSVADAAEYAASRIEAECPGNPQSHHGYGSWKTNPNNSSLKVVPAR